MRIAMTEEERRVGENLKAQEELRLLYIVTTQDLAFFKQQQWSITNYGLLGYAAIVGIPQILKENVSSCERLNSLPTGYRVSHKRSLFVVELERSVKARRDRLTKIRRLFTKAFCLAWRSNYKAMDSPTISILLGTVLGVGLGVVWWLVYFFSFETDEARRRSTQLDRRGASTQGSDWDAR